MHKLVGDILKADDLEPRDFEDLMDAINRKRRALALKQAASLKTGDKVLLRNLKPKYLSGLLATVIVSMPGEKIRVRIDEGQNTGRYARELTVPMTCLEAL